VIYLGCVLYAIEDILPFLCCCELQQSLRLRDQSVDAPRTYQNSRPPGRQYRRGREILVNTTFMPMWHLGGIPVIRLPGFCTVQVQLAENSGTPCLGMANARRGPSATRPQRCIPVL
jgi:hypothetical protein